MTDVTWWRCVFSISAFVVIVHMKCLLSRCWTVDYVEGPLVELDGGEGQEQASVEM